MVIIEIGSSIIGKHFSRASLVAKFPDKHSAYSIYNMWQPCFLQGYTTFEIILLDLLNHVSKASFLLTKSWNVQRNTMLMTFKIA